MSEKIKIISQLDDFWQKFISFIEKEYGYEIKVEESQGNLFDELFGEMISK